MRRQKPKGRSRKTHKRALQAKRRHGLSFQADSGGRLVEPPQMTLVQAVDQMLGRTQHRG